MPEHVRAFCLVDKLRDFFIEVISAILEDENPVVSIVGTDNLFPTICIQIGDAAAGKKRRFPDKVFRVSVGRGALKQKSPIAVADEDF